MNAQRILAAGFVFLSLLLCPVVAWSQATPAGILAGMTEQQIRDVLVFNSPWESRSTLPGQVYRFRTNFIARGDGLVAQVLRYATNEQGDSVVSVKEGKVLWQDTSGADVSVAIDGESLVGTAISKTTTFSVLFKPRP